MAGAAFDSWARARSRFLVEEVDRIGAEPYQAPEPLPPVDREEIQLICWLGIEARG